ncbi:MAG TPA: NAD-dependent epimerase/dehydratase family protein [Myxococcota bacterium]
MEKVLITGISGGQGRLLARRLRARYEVCGVDGVRWDGAPRGVRVHIADIRQKSFQDVIRREAPGAVVHLGFGRRFHISERERYDVNVRGTRLLLDHCVRHGVQKLVVLSSSYVYGASPENAYSLDEDSPLSASRSVPEIRDLVEVDTLASALLWRDPQLRTCVLRPVGVLGHYVHSVIGRYLRERRVPTVMGFDPMMQFIHEQDFTEAIALTLDRGLQGVFNVAGPGEVPLHTAIRESGGMPIALPEVVIRPLCARLYGWGLVPYPPGAIDYLKFPVTVSGKRFADASGFSCRFGLEEIFESVRR